MTRLDMIDSALALIDDLSITHLRSEAPPDRQISKAKTVRSKRKECNRGGARPAATRKNASSQGVNIVVGHLLGLFWGKGCWQ